MLRFLPKLLRLRFLNEAKDFPRSLTFTFDNSMILAGENVIVFPKKKNGKKKRKKNRITFYRTAVLNANRERVFPGIISNFYFSLGSNFYVVN